MISIYLNSTALGILSLLLFKDTSFENDTIPIYKSCMYDCRQSSIKKGTKHLELLAEVVVRPKKRNCLFPVTVRKKIGYIGRSVKKIFQKCVFYACFTLIESWEG